MRVKGRSDPFDATSGLGQNVILTKFLQLSHDQTLKACPGISTDASLVDFHSCGSQCKLTLRQEVPSLS
jgi:hypothetical protein